MAHRAHHSLHKDRGTAKHHTTRSGATKDTRPAQAQKQQNKALDPTGSLNDHASLSTNQNRGQTLGNGPWSQTPDLTSMGAENVTKWQ